MKLNVSSKTKDELLEGIKAKYRQASWQEKGNLIDALIATMGYDRKYAISLINRKTTKPTRSQKRGGKPTYNGSVKQALLTVWRAANCICSKRLVPHIPELVTALEKNGHLPLTDEVKTKLLKISSATVDRLLAKERQSEQRNSICTTSTGIGSGHKFDHVV